MKLNKESLADKAYSIIEEMIVTLDLEPGVIFSESELSLQIELGRTPMREALQRLTADRLITTIPRRGVAVTEINIKDHLALLETRRVLDELLITRAAKRATPIQRDILAANAKKMAIAADTEDLDEYMRVDKLMDFTISEAAKNPFASQISYPLHAHCRRFWYYYKTDNEIKEIAELHVNIMTTVANGLEEDAGKASHKLMDYVELFTRRAIEL